MPAVSPEQHVILLVDDQEPDVVLIKRAFSKAGLKYPLISVPGGLEALAYLNGDPPYHDRARYPFPVLVLLDVRMPVMDGFEVLASIRHDPRFASLPVVLLTGSHEKGQADRAQQAGATSFIIKSLDFANSDLFSTVSRLLESGPP